MKKTVAVTGGNGFIGAYVVSALLASGHDPIVVDHASHPKSQPTRYLYADVTNRTAMFELAAHADAVIHLAAVLGTQETIGNPLPSAETNVFGGINLLDACRQYDLPIVYAGVGNHWMLNTYSTTKTTTERLLMQYRNEFGLRAAVVRPVNAYGPGQKVAEPFGPGKVRKIIPAFVCRALSGMPIEIYGSGAQISSMVHVRDVADVFVKTLENLFSGVIPPAPIEVGAKEVTSVLETAELVREISGRITNNQPPPIKFLPMRPGELEKSLVDPKKLEEFEEIADALFSKNDAIRVKAVVKTLGTTVHANSETLDWIGAKIGDFISLEDGLTETVGWYRDQKGLSWNQPA